MCQTNASVYETNWLFAFLLKSFKSDDKAYQSWPDDLQHSMHSIWTLVVLIKLLPDNPSVALMLI